MPSAKDLASALAAEFGKRNINANLSRTSDDYACDAEINNMPVSIYFGTDVDHGDIRWMATDDQVHRIPNRDIDPSDLADRIIDTCLNPA
jgi:hypothetical protein